MGLRFIAKKKIQIRTKWFDNERYIMNVQNVIYTMSKKLFGEKTQLSTNDYNIF